MEKISAACAMDWSIALEKSLRSKIPGKPIEGILLIGQNLERWCFEPESQMTACNIDVKMAIVRVFRRLRRKRMKMRNKVWMLSKQRVSNAPELLKRVKVVFDTGNAELRSMALVMFGCWADFSKDSAHVRYLILSSMVSSEELEVKASLFAAGCFCELSDDFASVTLHMLGSLLMSSDIPSSIRLAGARTFSKMRCSLSIMNMGYKTGLELVLNSQEEELMSTMMCSLSLLACNSPQLASKQVSLLFTLLTEGGSEKVQKIALKCLCKVFEVGVCHFLVVTQIKALLDIVNSRSVSPMMQRTALTILYQVRFNLLPSGSRMSVPDFLELLKCLEVVSQSQVRSTSLLSIRILTSLAISLADNKDVENGETIASIPTCIITSIFEKITVLLEPFPQVNSAVIDDVRVMFNLLLQMGTRHSSLSGLVLGEMTLLTGCLLTRVEASMPSLGTTSGNEVRVSKDKETHVMTSNFILTMCRYLTDLFHLFTDSDQVKEHVLEKVKVLTECVRRSDFLTSHGKAKCLLLLSNQTVWTCMKETQMDEQRPPTFDSYLMDCECAIILCVSKMLAEKEYWRAYNAGICAACQGAWLISVSVFDSLRTRVHSELNRCWLETLAQFSLAEMCQQLVLPSMGRRWKGYLRHSEISTMLSSWAWMFDTSEEGTVLVHDTAMRTQKLLEAFLSMSSSYEMVKSEITAGGEFLFQSWFLALKKKLLEIIVGLLKLFVSIPSVGDMANENGLNEPCQVDCMTYMRDIILFSFKMQRLSEEFDLLAASLIGVDKSSHKTISTLAFGCSLLSFSAGFAFFMSDVPGINQMLFTYDLRKFPRAVLLQNLLGRLPYLNDDVIAIFSSLLDANEWPPSFSPLPSKIQLADANGIARPLVSLCHHVLSRVTDARNKARDMGDEFFHEVINIGRDLLMNIMEQWFQIRFPAPKCFFKIRPWMGAELFAVDANTVHQEGMFVLRGRELSLNLSLQLRNSPPNLPVHLMKFHAIIHCNQSFEVPGPTAEPSFRISDTWESGELVDLNERLFHHAIYGDHAKLSSDHSRNGTTGFLTFEVNESGIGFSNCLLDVSGFPVGKFRMKWHGCFIDLEGSYKSLLPLNPGPVLTLV
ncbi:hypothetical protein MLD38_013573 [Melastoma candidum]|uniref:Uncharacterized protein n=1 Tax=Melastoma candidum TaxID=119954 RepID=A0ACB9RIH4_9MYRT|nr:hypothetical protein MLD38_013573 [Melastoma candidum]